MINEQLSRIPLFGRTRALSLSKDKTELVISYSENPPQLWRITSGKILEFTPQHTYHYTTRTNPPRELSGWWGSPGGRSFFCGTGDNLVVCWDYDSDIFQVWDKNTAVPLFHFDGSGGVGSIKSIAVNESHDSLAFATVSFHGKIAIWVSDKSQHRIEDLSDGSDVEDEQGTSIVRSVRRIFD